MNQRAALRRRSVSEGPGLQRHLQPMPMVSACCAASAGCCCDTSAAAAGARLLEKREALSTTKRLGGWGLLGVMGFTGTGYVGDLSWASIVLARRICVIYCYGRAVLFTEPSRHLHEALLQPRVRAV